MYFIYQSTAKIDEYGDVLFEVEGDGQCFSFRAGVSEMVLPTLFSDFTAMLNGGIHSFEVDGNEAMTYYWFKRNGSKLRIEMKHWHHHEVYEFLLHNFCQSLHIAFKRFFRQQRLSNKEEAAESILMEWKKFENKISAID